jgi:hypothetical protein
MSEERLKMVEIRLECLERSAESLHNLKDRVVRIERFLRMLERGPLP